MFALVGMGCATSEPHAKFDYAIPAFSARVTEGRFEYVKLGAIGRASIPERREAMKATHEIGLVNEAVRQIYAQAPPGEPIALVNVVVEVSQRTVERSVLFVWTRSVREDVELVIRADIIRFLPPADASAPRAE